MVRMCGTLLFVIILALFAQAADSVWVEPIQPTAHDSLVFNLFNEQNCCCADYHNKTVIVNDTSIILQYQIDTDPCLSCRCLVAGSWTQFEHEPVVAGTYSIFKAQGTYCPVGKPCPLAAAPLLEKVGKVTVHGSTSAKMDISHDRQRGVSDSPVRVSYRASDQTLYVHFAQPRKAAIELFTAGGVRLAVIHTRAYFSSGEHVINIGANADIAGVAIVAVRCDERTITAQICGSVR